MKSKSTFCLSLRHFLLSILFLSCNLSMAQECTIDFSNFTIDTPDGTITVGENTTVCINQTVNLPNLAFQAGSNQPNPGIIWAVYDCQPTTVNPDDDDCKRPVVLRDPEGNVIIGGGEADFSFANLPEPGESEITVCLVPILDGDTSGLAIEDDCTGIAVGLDYPCITFLVPEDNPTQCESDCDAFEVNDECVDAIPLTLQAGTVVFPTEADSVYSNVCATRENDLAVPTCFLDANTANTVWFSFEGTGGEYTINTNACEEANVVIADSQMAIYTGDCDGLTEVACNDDIGGGNFLSSITEFPTEAGVTYHIMVDGLNNESGEFCIEITETAPPCDADFGTVNFEGEVTTCEGGSFNFTLTGDATDGFTSGFVVINEEGTIVDIFNSGSIDLVPGTYTVFAINFDDAAVDAVNAAISIEALNALNVCMDLQEEGIEIIVLFDGTPDCCNASINSLSAVGGETTVCQVAGESLDFNVNGANTGAEFSNVWYYEQNGVLTLGGVFSADVNPLTFIPTLMGIEAGTVSIFVVNVLTSDTSAVIDAIEAGANIEEVIAADDVCADLVNESLVITILPPENPDCIACEPNAGNSSASVASTCEGECIDLSVTGDNQNEGFATLLLVTTSDDSPILDAVSAGAICLEAGNYTIYSFNFLAAFEETLLEQINNGISINDLQLLADSGDFCGMLEAEGTNISFLPPNDDACYECDAAVGTIVNPAMDVTICFGEELIFQVEGDNTDEGFNTQFIGAVPDDLTIPIFIEDNLTQVLPVGVFEFYAINYAENEESIIIGEVSNGGTLTDLLSLINDNEFCAEISATPILVTVLPEDHPSCAGEPFDAEVTDITVSGDGLTYIVTITMSGGSGDYTIGGTEVEDSIFVSESIPCGEPFVFEASDGTFIEVLEGTSPCPEPCFADPGTMPQLGVVNPICDGEETNFNSTGSSLGEGDVLVYVLYDTETADLDNVLAVNPTSGTFSLASSAGLVTNQVYFISAAAGPDADGDGMPDSNNDCTLVSQGTQVVFLEPVSFMIDEFCDNATGDFFVSFQLEGGLPEFDNSSVYNISGDFSGTYALGEMAITVTYSTSVSANMYDFSFSDAVGCTATVSEAFDCVKTPIELLSFEGEVLAEGNHLQWITATEIDNDFFTLERSADGQDFEEIAFVKSQGNSVNVQSYEFLDRTAPKGTSYYRLRQTDFNGLSTVSHVVALQRGESGFEIVQVYPNPAKSKLHLTFTLTSSHPNVEISVYNMSGQQLQFFTQEGKAGINHVEMDVSDFPAGAYLVHLSNGSSVQVQKFIKK